MTDDSTIDAIDEVLLRLLRENARRPVAELARALDLSRTTVQSRLERLERRGIVTGYTVCLSSAAERARVRAHVLIAVQPKKAARAEAGLRRLPQITALYSVSGQHDLIAMVETGSVGEMDEVLDAIGALDGIDRTVSSIILSTRYRRPG